MTRTCSIRTPLVWGFFCLFPPGSPAMAVCVPVWNPTDSIPASCGNGAITPDSSWQAHDPQAFDASPLLIDWAQEVVTCPQGKQSRYGKPVPDPRGKPMIAVVFHKQDCAGCAVRSRCTRSTTGPRELTCTPSSPTGGAAGGTGTPADRGVQSTLQTPGGHRRNHVAGSLCIGDAADAIAGDQEDPSAPHHDRHCYESATLY